RGWLAGDRHRDALALPSSAPELFHLAHELAERKRAGGDGHRPPDAVAARRWLAGCRVLACARERRTGTRLLASVRAGEAGEPGDVREGGSVGLHRVSLNIRAVADWSC